MVLLRISRRLLSRSSSSSLFHTSSVLYGRRVIQTFKLADIGEGITECEVIKWNIKPLAKIQAFDQLCEVQSDKASVEITSPFDGIVKELLVQEGEVAKVGAGLCLIEVEDDALDGDHATVVESASPPSHPEQQVNEPTATHTSSQIPNLSEGLVEVSSQSRPHPLNPNKPPVPAFVPAQSSGNDLATPSVRHFARKNGVNLSELPRGSGRDGRIEKVDIEAYLAAQSGVSSAATTQSTSSPSDTVVELGRTRYGMWKAMEKSLEIPHFGYTTSLDITRLHNLLPTINAHIPTHFLPLTSSQASPSAVSPSSVYPAPTPPLVPASGQITKLTYLPILLKMLSRAMLEWPLFRASITPTIQSEGTSKAKPTLTIRPRADISIALSTPTGLYTPTLQGVEAHSVYSLASQLRHLAHLGRQTPSGLTPAEMPKRGGTVTVSNVGAIGAGDSAVPVLVPGGGVAIVAIGRAKWVWDVDVGDGSGERRLKLGVSWSADHRVVEGAELAAFVEAWRAWVENPERMIADGV